MKIPENLSSARASAAYPERKQGAVKKCAPFWGAFFTIHCYFARL